MVSVYRPPDVVMVKETLETLQSAAAFVCFFYGVCFLISMS